MAGKKDKAGGDKGAPKEPQAQQDQGPALVMPPTKTIQDLARAKRSAAAKVGEITSSLGGTINSAVEKKHVNKKALGIVTSLDKLDDEILAIVWPHLLRYADDLKIPTRAKMAEGMFPAEETGDDAHVEKDEETGNVTQIGSAARRVAERAGADN